MNSSQSVMTIKDLSRVSGFSVSTVSKALNNKLDISLSTRQTIKDIAAKYNYVPNNYAVALRKKRTKVISVIIPQVNTSFYSCFIFNIEKVAYTFGYRIILFQSFENRSKEEEFIKNSSDGSVDGAIILSKNRCLPNHFDAFNIPVECMQIDHGLDNKSLKKDCINSFKRLLRRIN